MRTALFSNEWKKDDAKFTQRMSAFHGVKDLGVVTESPRVSFLALQKVVETLQHTNIRKVNFSTVSKLCNVSPVAAELALNTWIRPFMKMVPSKRPDFLCTIVLCPHFLQKYSFRTRDDLVLHMARIHLCNRAQRKGLLSRSPLLEEAVLNKYNEGESLVSLRCMGNPLLPKQ